MKKTIVLLLFAILSIVSLNAEVLKFKSTYYSQQLMEFGGWGNWSDWKSCNVKIDINLDTDVVKIYSQREQTYRVTKYVGETEDDGYKTHTFRFTDQDGDRGTMRLIQRDSGRSEIYIDFANIRWAYIVQRI